MQRNMNFIKMSCIAVIISAVSVFSAGYVELSTSNITKYQVFPQYGNGDIVFTLNNMPSGKLGVYLSGNDTATKSSFASILSALANGYKIRIYYDDTLWSCTSCGVYYHIATVEIFPSGVIN